MPRPQTKDDLLKASEENYIALNKLIDGMSEKEMNTPFDFSNQPSKKEAHWGRDKNVRDVLVHLYEWQVLGIKFAENRTANIITPFLPEPYNFKTYGVMNVELWKKHQNTSFEEARKLLDESHKQIMEVIADFSNEELFTRGYYKWTGTNALGSYFVSNTSSHYDWAIKKIKAHIKTVSQK